MANDDIAKTKTIKKTNAKKSATTKSQVASPKSVDTPSNDKVTQVKKRESEKPAKKPTPSMLSVSKNDSRKLARSTADKPVVAGDNVQSVRYSNNLSSAVLETRYQKVSPVRRNTLGKVHPDEFERRLMGR